MTNATARRQNIGTKVAAIKKAMNRAGGDSPLTKMSANIVTAGDAKVCQACRMASQKGTPLPPDHPNCRCRVERS